MIPAAFLTHAPRSCSNTPAPSLTTQLIAAAEAPAPLRSPTEDSRAFVVYTLRAPPKKYCMPLQAMYSVYCGDTEAGKPCGTMKDAHTRDAACHGVSWSCMHATVAQLFLKFAGAFILDLRLSTGVILIGMEMALLGLGAECNACSCWTQPSTRRHMQEETPPVTDSLPAHMFLRHRKNEDSVCIRRPDLGMWQGQSDDT